jgi:hypothetical protein
VLSPLLARPLGLVGPCHIGPRHRGLARPVDGEGVEHVRHGQGQ